MTSSDILFHESSQESDVETTTQRPHQALHDFIDYMPHEHEYCAKGISYKTFIPLYTIPLYTTLNDLVMSEPYTGSLIA